MVEFGASCPVAQTRVDPVQDGWHDGERNVPASAEAVGGCFVVEQCAGGGEGSVDAREGPSASLRVGLYFGGELGI